MWRWLLVDPDAPEAEDEEESPPDDDEDDEEDDDDDDDDAAAASASSLSPGTMSGRRCLDSFSATFAGTTRARCAMAAKACLTTACDECGAVAASTSAASTSNGGASPSAEALLKPRLSCSDQRDLYWLNSLPRIVAAPPPLPIIPPMAPPPTPPTPAPPAPSMDVLTPMGALADPEVQAECRTFPRLSLLRGLGCCTPPKNASVTSPPDDDDDDDDDEVEEEDDDDDEPCPSAPPSPSLWPISSPPPVS